ncbi:glucose-1-phosphate adenylyltransferase [Pirellulaceae bacterium]|jgi:glucose-1-phosphate adenylyltransferase|nr:glucose-1-phosphate adenylyltransferase [Pirellulaceae bacterium]MDB4640461.1 glucose-1-phosphate adenylyltransferase [Pirellulaceae bacterium]
MKNVVAIVLGGGRGTRLSPLTSIRSKPAVPLAGKYRLIDIPISNCLNSGINKIYVLTQFLSVSLHSHIRRTYSFDSFNGGFVEILAAQQTMNSGTDWFEGTADAVRKTLDHIDDNGVDYVAILSGDQLYRMDFEKMLETHQKWNADVTIAALPVSSDDAKSFGVMRLDEDDNVLGFLEKPQRQEELDLVKNSPEWMAARGLGGDDRDCLASMGIYIFNRETLFDVLTKTTYTDFGKEVFPAAIRARTVKMHLFDGYWEDIGTIRSFYEANLSLTKKNPPFEFSSPEGPIYSRARFLPPTKLGDCQIKESLIADGCEIADGCVIENSVIGLRTKIESGTTIRNSILMGADFFEYDLEPQEIQLGIGANSLIDQAIVDKNCRIGSNVKIAGGEMEDSESADGFCTYRDGIAVIAKEAVIPSNWTN